MYIFYPFNMYMKKRRGSFMNNDINVGMAAADRRSHRDGMQELLQRRRSLVPKFPLFSFSH